MDTLQAVRWIIKLLFWLEEMVGIVESDEKKIDAKQFDVIEVQWKTYWMCHYVTGHNIPEYSLDIPGVSPMQIHLFVLYSEHRRVKVYILYSININGKSFVSPSMLYSIKQTEVNRLMNCHLFGEKTIGYLHFCNIQSLNGFEAEM